MILCFWLWKQRIVQILLNNSCNVIRKDAVAATLYTDNHFTNLSRRNSLSTSGAPVPL